MASITTIRGVGGNQRSSTRVRRLVAPAA